MGDLFLVFTLHIYIVDVLELAWNEGKEMMETRGK